MKKRRQRTAQTKLISALFGQLRCVPLWIEKNKADFGLVQEEWTADLRIKAKISLV
ncbi:hypothetical protein [Paenibacillus sp. NEAU-GSW1]|uniref:hypothetical protein n=1 Tax=Paenibacillus sp. NEAU-GSW1 TaxID=2682486 RepID=UPI0012E10E55|nr:hypothetical protein [Paenibacillus sp. NEAU-GSW1]MUT66952.1 hypothetical protein [Paenibacillus sp. NEAU-GSW1]